MYFLMYIHSIFCFSMPMQIQALANKHKWGPVRFLRERKPIHSPLPLHNFSPSPFSGPVLTTFHSFSPLSASPTCSGWVARQPYNAGHGLVWVHKISVGVLLFKMLTLSSFSFLFLADQGLPWTCRKISFLYPWPHYANYF